MKRMTKLLFAFALIAFGSLFIAKQNGQNKRYAGAPGDVVSTGCSDPGQGCHDVTPTPGATITLTGVPSSYAAGQVYPLTLTLHDPTGLNSGFQIVAKDAAAANAYTSIGTFTASTGTKVIAGTTASSNGPGRLVHSTDKMMSAGTVSWTFNWTAPTVGMPANVIFYYSAVACNNDGDETNGDKAYKGNSANVPIGIELMSFDATIEKGNQVELAWKTATEKDNKAFVIERKVDNSPFFEEVGKVNGNGTTHVAQSYTFMDATPQSGKINYYRLRQEDFDGTTTYSKVVSVALKTAFKIKVFPSIVKNGDVLTVETAGTSGTSVDIDVVNMNGQIVKMDKNDCYTEGGQFHVSNLPAGRYIVKVRNGEKKNYASFVVN